MQTTAEQSVGLGQALARASSITQVPSSVGLGPKLTSVAPSVGRAPTVGTDTGLRRTSSRTQAPSLGTDPRLSRSPSRAQAPSSFSFIREQPTLRQPEASELLRQYVSPEGGTAI